MTDLVVDPFADDWREPTRLTDGQLIVVRAEAQHGYSLSATVALSLLDHISALNREIGGLHESLDMATGPHCSGCGNPIDPDYCWCGDVPHSSHEGHHFIPMGCDCARHERDWKKLAAALRERLWATQLKLNEATSTERPR